MLNHSFGFYAIALFAIILCRYFLVAGGTYWLVYAVCRQRFGQQPAPLPSGRSIRHDIYLSILSAGVFAGVAALTLSGYDWGLTRLYHDPYQYGLGYLGVSYGAVLVLQDTYFYFTHRLLHHPWLFRWLHQGHHRSRYPTPWTSFAFDPLEAIGQSLFLVGVICVVPLHFMTVMAVLVTMTIWAVINHLGIDHLPRSFPHQWFGKWCIGPAHHAIHHRKYRWHYGLYFTFWDHLLGTQDPQYDEQLGIAHQPRSPTQ